MTIRNVKKNISVVDRNDLRFCSIPAYREWFKNEDCPCRKTARFMDDSELQKYLLKNCAEFNPEVLDFNLNDLTFIVLKHLYNEGLVEGTRIQLNRELQSIFQEETFQITMLRSKIRSEMIHSERDYRIERPFACAYHLEEEIQLLTENVNLINYGCVLAHSNAKPMFRPSPTLKLEMKQLYTRILNAYMSHLK
jgi:hypothetical protein